LELLIGCGANLTKKIGMPDNTEWNELVTLDFNEDHKPDVVHDLTDLPLPFPDNKFDEIHAYEVLEHTGQQGDFKFFFDQFNDFWRILKPNGFLCGTSPLPASKWAWGDPGHTRIISQESFVFLSQQMYMDQVGKTPMSDYRFCYHGDFEPVHLQAESQTFVYVLQAIKPARMPTP
jgi:SAM-dependent methyltransferase